MTMRIEMLPAEHGDCLLVETGEGDARLRLLIDAGPVSAFPRLRARIEQLDPADRHVDVFVITHVDTDHIEGALPLVQATDLGLTIGDVWFNGLAHLESGAAAGPERGGVQGEYLAALLHDRPWNDAWAEGLVGLAADGSTQETGDKATDESVLITVLSPGADQCRRMANAWRTTCEKAKLPVGDVSGVLDELGDDSRYAVSDRGGERGKRSFGGDGSAPNGSSIAFLLEQDGRAVLFTGDAYAEVLVPSITALLETRSAEHTGGPTQERLRLDALKLSHHGSCRNVSPALLDLLDCDTFLVSTNGAKFKHPDPETIELLATRGAQRGVKPTVHFNYRSATTEKYADDARITAVYGDDGHHVVTF